jgi:nitrogen fixation NifU-like protein
LSLGRQRQIAALVERYQNPRYQGTLEDADVAMPGGSPECGGSVVIYVKGGEGDIISQAATSMILEQVMEARLTIDEVLALDYDAFVDRVGREAVGSRTRNATLGLSTLKSALRKYQKDRLLAGPTAAELSRNGG